MFALPQSRKGIVRLLPASRGGDRPIFLGKSVVIRALYSKRAGGKNDLDINELVLRHAKDDNGRERTAESWGSVTH